MEIEKILISVISHLITFVLGGIIKGIVDDWSVKKDKMSFWTWITTKR